MARSRGGRRAPAGPARVRSARRSGAAAVWRTAPSRATTRSAPPRRWCGSRCVRALSDRASERRSSSSTTGRSTRRRPRTRSSCSRRSACARRASASARVLVVLFRTDENAWKSLRNLGERVQIVLPEELNTYDVLLNDWLVFSQAALETTDRPALPSGARPTSRARWRHREGPPRHHHQAGRVGEVVRGLRPQRLHVRRRARRQQDRDPQRGRAAVRRRVEKVHTINRKGKRTRNRSTGAYNHRRSQKRAIVTLAAGEERIDIFGS